MTRRTALLPFNRGGRLSKSLVTKAALKGLAVVATLYLAAAATIFVFMGQ